MTNLQEENLVLHELVKQLEPFEQKASFLSRQLMDSRVTIGEYALREKELQRHVAELESVLDRTAAQCGQAEMASATCRKLAEERNSQLQATLDVAQARIQRLEDDNYRVQQELAMEKEQTAAQLKDVKGLLEAAYSAKLKQALSDAALWKQKADEAQAICNDLFAVIERSTTCAASRLFGTQ
eukprot:TRINITY_DN2611_c0_g1_i10.p3 TRINITY_DN2611_c0_g1~~TRINITY_DN2611_c0_g1_i10.p3  ORF type:complete len:201 (-),score=65.69 TRINITY_DN2611_c0_g1_i10:1349-1897(-)